VISVSSFSVSIKRPDLVRLLVRTTSKRTGQRTVHVEDNVLDLASGILGCPRHHESSRRDPQPQPGLWQVWSSEPMHVGNAFQNAFQ
jgi:hypothetical protein